MEIFYLIADEFCNNKKELGLISDAIKRNRLFFENSVFGSEYENLDFPEGALMEHLHKYIERRDSGRLNARWFVMFANSTWPRYINLCHITLTSFICLCPSPSLM